MANNVNPFTGRNAPPEHMLELQNGRGYICFDAEDGLMWGDSQLHPGEDADKLFRQLVGKGRPDAYKSYLGKFPAPDDDANSDQTEAGSAQEVMDEDAQFSQVVVTNAKSLDFAALSGFPGSVSAGAVEVTSTHNAPVNNRARNADVNVGTLGAGASKTGAGGEELDADGNTPATAAARAKADKMAGIVQTSDAATDAEKLSEEVKTEGDDAGGDQTEAVSTDQKSPEDIQAAIDKAAADRDEEASQKAAGK